MVDMRIQLVRLFLGDSVPLSSLFEEILSLDEQGRT